MRKLPLYQKEHGLTVDFQSPDFIDSVLAIGSTAATAITEIYNSGTAVEVQLKADRSPLTIADLTAHRIIESGLKQLTPGIPIISEEGQLTETLPMPADQFFWLVDPLDGTKEFIRRTGEFTVNIALIYQHQPVLGVVIAPMLQSHYWGVLGKGAYFTEGSQAFQALSNSRAPKDLLSQTKSKSINQSKPQATRMRVNNTPTDPIKVAISRSHNTGKIWETFLQTLEATYPNRIELIYCGSALKICLVARGVADVYPRLGPTGAWDTAAGHIILKEACGVLTDLAGRELLYGAGDKLLNPQFLATNPYYQEAFLTLLANH